MRQPNELLQKPNYPTDSIQSQFSNTDPAYFYPFESSEMVNGYAFSIAELIREILGNEYWYNLEFPLQSLCSKGEPSYLPKEMWQFWVNSRVDLAVMNTKLGANCRKAALVIECQSPFHDSPEAQQRDRMKAKILEPTGIPLVYVRYVDYPRVLRFWVSSGDQLLYHPFTWDGWGELVEFIKQQCL